MPTFNYQGRDQTGKRVTGKRLAQSADTLGTQLLKDGIFPVEIKMLQENQRYWQRLQEYLQPKVTVDELSLFARQMHTLCKAGVPVTAALRQLAQNTRSRQMATALYGMIERVESGQDLARAMQHYPQLFKPIMVSMIQVGQSAGRLDDAFLHLNQYLELEASALKNIKTALRYPAIIFLTVIVAVIVMNIFVVPTFATLFAQSNVALPAVTRGLIAVSHFMREKWYVLGFLLAAGVWALCRYLRTDRGKLRWGRMQLSIPIVGKVLRRIILLRFSQSFAIVLNSGIGLVDGLTLVALSIENTYAKREMNEMREFIQRGKNITAAAANTTLFTQLELQMLSVSEETGELSTMLSDIAVFYKREVDYDLKRLSDMIEPILIILLAIVILLLAFSIYLPIWDMVDLVHS